MEFKRTSLLLAVSWVLTCGVTASAPILSSVTLSVFVAVTDSPGVTLRLQCTIRHPRRLPGRVTAQSSNPSETQCVLLPGDSPSGVYSLSSGAEFGNSASGHAMLLSLWMLIITLQLLQCCSGHRGVFLEEIKSWVRAAETRCVWQRLHSVQSCTPSLAWCRLVVVLEWYQYHSVIS